MLISNIYVNKDAQSIETPRKKYSVTEPGGHILLGFDESQLFVTPRINNHSVTEPSAPIVLGDVSAHSFEPHPQETIMVSLHQVPIFFRI